jgi:hypothetical protein
VSTRNRERRKANKKIKEQRRREYGAGESSVRRVPPAELVEALMGAAIAAIRRDDEADLDRQAGLLAYHVGGPDGHQIVDQRMRDFLDYGVADVWRRGWLPADVVRIAERRCGPRHARMAIDAIAAQLRQYAEATIDERWTAQLSALEATVWWPRDDSYVDAWGGKEGLTREEAIRCVAELLNLLASLPALAILGPLPGTARRGALSPDRVAGREADQRMLDKVRALLAKAESTEFPEEAEAYTAKAQELMARHSIDYALIAAQSGNRDEPTGCRVGVDNPYDSAKALLLQKVAEANRCRAVWAKEFGFATVLGFAADLDAVELLYTSLLVQATAAMLHEGPRRDRSGQSRTRSFRQSFLNSYAIRIGERLMTATEAATTAAAEDLSQSATAEDRDRLLPVLAARDGAVQDAVDEMFPGLTSYAVRINNQDGWASGRAAADLASLHVRKGVTI